jgi:peptidoglycan/LPS O-acetylase OafA/YrhL
MIAATPSDGGGRVAALDGLRGVAIALVVIFHFFLATSAISTSRADDVVTKITGAGWTGVDLFFVLSGFLITGILLEAKSSLAPYFRTFYARRFLRIFPVYYGFLAFLLFVLPLVQTLEPSLLEESRRIQGWYWTYLANIRIAIDGGARNDLLETWHLWSLSIEEQFYLVWPALVLLLSRKQMLWLSAGCIFGALALRIGMRAGDVHPMIVYTLTPARLDALAAGSLLALVARDPAMLREFARYAWPAAAAAGTLVIALFAWHREFSPFEASVQTAGFSALVVLFAALLLKTSQAAPGSVVHGMMTPSWLRALGRYSYALYVVHWPVAVIINRQWNIAEEAPEAFGSALPGRLLFFALAFAISYAIAFASWHLFEKQFLRLKERFPYRSAPEVAAAAPGGSEAVP